MLLPLRTDVPPRSRPWMNWLIILVNVGISIWGWKYPSVADQYELNARDPHISNFITYAFLHQPGAWAPWLSVHLLGNMLALYLFGNNVNDRLGHVGYLALYLAGAVFAGVGCVLIPGSGPRVIGASGAVMAVTAAYLALFPRSHILLAYFFFLANGVVEVPCIWLISFFLALDLAMNLAGSSGVAHSAHLWGAMLGFFLMLTLLWLRLLTRDPFDFLALLQRSLRRRAYRRLVAEGFNPFGPPLPLPPSVRPEEDDLDPAVERIKELRAQVHEAIAHHNLPHAAILYIDLKTLDPDQVLSRQAQLDVANQLASQHFYPEAADAYEQFLRAYANFPQIEHVQLMLGIIYARYLNRPSRARELLTQATIRLHGEHELKMAREELEKLT